MGAAAAAAGSRSTVRCTMRNACAHVNERAVMSDLGKFLIVDVGCVLLKYHTGIHGASIEQSGWRR